MFVGKEHICKKASSANQAAMWKKERENHCAARLHLNWKKKKKKKQGEKLNDILNDTAKKLLHVLC